MGIGVTEEKRMSIIIAWAVSIAFIVWFLRKLYKIEQAEEGEK